ncbi:E3 ubiquitin-protein ligase SGR9, amyloplastic [Andrographis paniculata]|uniref:E3 ubiquitin-protein ligase SGR9, amyloplastic n=1 Tax=Andrographis paniculata TaxID=175694 RepID=UPI0021E7DC0C|nr:E3 ubiquitin-protein ligase SGR9, amyloplastic [Andrographis paniculata]
MDSMYSASLMMGSLSTLPSSHFSQLTQSISAVVRHRRLHRLSAVLSSPALFSLALLTLQSLSLHHKSLLVAHYLFSNLTLLKTLILNPSHPDPTVKLRDLDSVLLLLLLCEVDRHDRTLLDAPPSRWRVALRDYMSDSLLRVSTCGGFSAEGVLLEFVESVGRCWNLVDVMCCGGGKGDTAAAAAAVAALPTVEVRGEYCAICKEDMGEDRDRDIDRDRGVCAMPCGHLFHWECILRWLGDRNTCPCCRHRLPTDDIHRDIKELLDDLAQLGGSAVAVAC